MKFGDVYGAAVGQGAESTEEKGHIGTAREEHPLQLHIGHFYNATNINVIRARQRQKPWLSFSLISFSLRGVMCETHQCSAMQWQLLILHVQPGVLCWCSLCMAVQRCNDATTYNGSRQRRGKPCQCLQLRQS